MYKFLASLLIVAVLAGCTTTFGQCKTSMTEVTLVNGELVYKPVTKSCGPPTGNFASISAGPMPAPPPGKEWWNLFR